MQRKEFGDLSQVIQDFVSVYALGQDTLNASIQEGFQDTQARISAAKAQLLQQIKTEHQETRRHIDKSQQEHDVKEANRICLQHLRTTDPRHDKRRIELTKGSLLKDSYRWILDNPQFRLWHNDEQSRLLWIRGDPGKGKTMLLCGIIDELEETPSAASASGCCLLSYFFCQATDLRINNAAAVLRGLISRLTVQQPALLQHVRTMYDA